jgi:hypothetical protein
MTRTSAKDRLAAVLAAACVGACTAAHLAAPSRPAVRMGRAHHETLRLLLRRFDVHGQTEVDTAADVELLQDLFLDHVESVAAFAAVEYDLARKRPADGNTVELGVELTLGGRHERTWVLDVVSGALAGLWPLVPAWGEAEVTLTATLAVPEAAPFATLRETVRAPYSAMFYAWYRREFVEQAYRRALDAVLARMASQVRVALDAHVAAGTPSPPSDSPELGLTGPSLVAEQSEAEPPVVVLPAEGFNVITTVPPRRGGLLEVALSALGGVEVSGILGIARVTSSAKLENGEKRQVASGNSRQLGYRVSLYSAPKRTGPFVYPVIGYLRQQIDNVDTPSLLSQLNVLRDDRGDIGAIATDPDTGREVDAGAANPYHLDMQSGYGGARVGYDLVGGTSSFELFASLTLGLNLVEYRTIRSELAECGTDATSRECRTAHQGWDFLKSGAVGATLGFRLPRLHSALRFIFDYEVYRHFRYEHPLEVRGPAIYDEASGLFQHDFVFMRGASLECFSFQLALAGVF